MGLVVAGITGFYERACGAGYPISLASVEVSFSTIFPHSGIAWDSFWFDARVSLGRIEIHLKTILIVLGCPVMYLGLARVRSADLFGVPEF